MARNVKNASAALAPPASAGDRLPGRGRKGADISMADALENDRSGLGTSRDKRSYSTYGYVRRLNDTDLRTMNRKSWLANAIVSTPVEDMVREWVTVKWPGITPEEQAAIKRAERRLGLKPRTQSGLTWGGLFGGAGMIPIIAGQDVSQPLDMKRIPKGSLRRLIVKDRTWLVPMPGAPDRDIENSDNYGLPRAYGVRGSSALVHPSRVARFEGHELPEDDFLANGYWHDSELQHVVTATMDYDASTENVASLLWEMKLDIIKTSLAALIAAKDGGASLEKRYQDAALGKSNHRLLLINKDEEYDRKGLALGGVSDLLAHFVVQACGASRTPMVKLFGESAPGLNATGEVNLRIYYDRIASEADRKMLPVLNFIYELIVRSELGRMPEGFEVCPNALWQVDAKTQALIDLQSAQADDIYLKNNPSMIGAVMRRLQARGTYPLTDADIALAESMEQPIEPAADPADKNEPDPGAAAA